MQHVLTELADKPKNFSLAGKFYNDPALYQMDLENIWYKDWIFVGHDFELANTGDYMTLPLGEHNVVIINQGDSLQAFYNRCPVSGYPLCNEESGNQQTLGDSGATIQYQLDGQSLGEEEAQLQAIALNSVQSYMFICLAEEPEDFETFSSVVEPYMAPHSMDNLKIATQSSIIEEGNWKLVFENNRECYHCLSNHPELIITYPEDPAVTGVSPSGEVPEMVSDHWERCEAAGLPSRFKISDKGDFRVARMPLLKDFTSYTMSGSDAVAKPLCDESLPNVGALVLFHYPNTWNHFLGDHVISFRTLPLGPQKTLVTTHWMVRADAEEGVDYNPAELLEVWEATNAQDKHLVEENQRGINSPLYAPGPYSVNQEDGVIQFVEWYTNTLQERLS